MPASPFSRTTRSLADDGLRGVLVWMALATAALLGWGAWSQLARIVVIEASTAARLEVATTVHPLVSEVEARVLRVAAVAGQAVERGDLLIELDASLERLRLAEERTRLRSSEQQASALEAQLRDSDDGLRHDLEALHQTSEEALRRRDQAVADVRLRQRELDSLRGLAGGKLVSDLEMLRAETEASKRGSEAEALTAGLLRSKASQLRGISDRKAAIEALRRDLERLRGDAAMSRAAIERLDHEVARRQIRAPVGGTLAELQSLVVGALVRVGDRLGAVLPRGRLLVVAQFPPAAALGRVRAGQPARMRLAGFPWAEYGTLQAEVERVAAEVRDGTVRVELAIAGAPGSRVALQHGLPGTVEVEVERASPASILLRAAGQAVSASIDRGSAAAPTAGAPTASIAPAPVGAAR